MKSTILKNCQNERAFIRMVSTKDIFIIEPPFRTLSMTYSASERVDFSVIRRRAKQGINAFQLP